MNVEYLIQLLENKMMSLTNTRAMAFANGDLVTINAVETEIAGLNDTLYKLRLLLTATQVAAATNTDMSKMITAGVEAIQNMPVVLDNATAVMGEYDISTYATDPLHERKIADILESMGIMDSVGVIDAYIDKEAISSPVTGQMVLSAVQAYSVDTRLTMAIMELDSRFGTAGVAVDTRNPGNVGNTGTEMRTYGSWEEGVSAVAEWLSRHRVSKPAAPVPVAETPVTSPVVAPVETPVTPPVTETPVVPPVVPAETPVVETPVVPPVETPVTPPVVEVPVVTPPVVEAPVVPPVVAPVETPVTPPVTETPVVPPVVPAETPVTPPAAETPSP